MAKFTFYQDKEVKTWVRDYYQVEANTIEEAIEFIKGVGNDALMDEIEYKHPGKVEFNFRDSDWMFEQLVDLSDADEPKRYSIYTPDKEEFGGDMEVISKY